MNKSINISIELTGQFEKTNNILYEKYNSEIQHFLKTPFLNQICDQKNRPKLQTLTLTLSKKTMSNETTQKPKSQSKTNTKQNIFMIGTLVIVPMAGYYLYQLHQVVTERLTAR